MRVEQRSDPGRVVVRRAPRLGHRRALDGLRGLAIIAVFLFHVDAFYFPAGNSGVTVFFVLSGFLITTILLEEVADTGQVGLRRFYIRRALRLVPALALMVSVFVIV